MLGVVFCFNRSMLEFMSKELLDLKHVFFAFVHHTRPNNVIIVSSIKESNQLIELDFQRKNHALFVYENDEKMYEIDLYKITSDYNLSLRDKQTHDWHTYSFENFSFIQEKIKLLPTNVEFKVE